MEHDKEKDSPGAGTPGKSSVGEQLNELSHGVVESEKIWQETKDLTCHLGRRKPAHSTHEFQQKDHELLHLVHAAEHQLRASLARAHAAQLRFRAALLRRQAHALRALDD